MAITLDTITLPALKMYPETFAQVELGTVAERAIDGTLHEWARSEPGFAIDLTGTANKGWITKAILDDLSDLAAVKDATYELVYEALTYNVRFRIEDKPVIEADPIRDRVPEQDTDEYNNVVIKLWRD